MPAAGLDAALGEVARRVQACQACPLYAGRVQAVPGEGSARSGIVLVGEAPGRKEDESGRPFVGSAGRNLDLALAEAGIGRQDVFVTSIVKCRPPDNRDPTPAEKAACRPHLLAQLEALRPRVLVALGRHGLHGLLGDLPVDFARLAGTILERPGHPPVFVSLHPAAVIYRQKWKAKYLDDWRRFGAWVRSGQPASAFRPGPPLSAVPPTPPAALARPTAPAPVAAARPPTPPPATATPRAQPRPRHRKTKATPGPRRAKA